MYYATQRECLAEGMADLDAVHNVELFISLNCYVACGEPSIAERILGGLLVAEIALSHDWAANKELSGGSRWNILNMSVLRQYNKLLFSHCPSRQRF
jgi:hypothetical protein